MKTKRILSNLLSIAVISSNLLYPTLTCAESKLIAFPGAEGGGMYTTGARGAESIEIYHVTNLNDSGQGSFREALSGSNRMIVFDVAGNILLKSAIRVNGVSNITILGQTSPGEGICVAGESTLFENCENIIIRYVRFRPGDVGTSQEDALGVKRCKDFIVDHCSVTWSVDEAFSAYANRNFTAQYNIIAQSLYNSVHEKGAHAYGGIWGGENVSFHHNLIAHHYSRMPRIGTSATVSNYNDDPDTDGLIDIKNNVFYNWVTRPGYGGENGVRVNFVGNYYKPGPSSQRTDQYYLGYDGENGTTVVYANDNIMEGNANATFANVTKSVSENEGNYPINTVSPSVAYSQVLSDVGSNVYIDSIDKNIIDSVKNGTAFLGSKNDIGLIDSQEDVDGWVYLTGVKKKDTDNDGIPDEWEDINGLNKSNPLDSLNYVTGGYTNLEKYADDLISTRLSEKTNTENIRKAIFKAQNLNRDYYYEEDLKNLDDAVEKSIAALSSTQNEINAQAEKLNSILNSLEYRYKNLLKDYIIKIENADSSNYNKSEWNKLLGYIEKAKIDLQGEENNALFKSDYELLKSNFEDLNSNYSSLYNLITEYRSIDPNSYTKPSYAKLMSVLDELEDNIPSGMTDSEVTEYENKIRSAFWNTVEPMHYNYIDDAISFLKNTWDNQYLTSTDINNIEIAINKLEALKGRIFDDNIEIDAVYNNAIDILKNLDVDPAREYKQKMGINTEIKNTNGNVVRLRTLSTGDSGFRCNGDNSVIMDKIDEANYFGIKSYLKNGHYGIVLDDKYFVCSSIYGQFYVLNIDNYSIINSTASPLQIVDVRLRDVIFNFDNENHKVNIWVDNVKYEIDVPTDAKKVTKFGIINRNYFNNSSSESTYVEFSDMYSFNLNVKDNPTIYGDADNDGTITSNDSAIVLQKVLQAENVMPIEEAKENYMSLIDVNQDDKLTSSDAAFILQKALNNLFEMPIEK
ncbi:MAG: hypothetical protein IJS61_04000 [Firmicutes bacterium]|nr:hypothetical protein [Bacillota bacterium]